MYFLKNLTSGEGRRWNEVIEEVYTLLVSSLWSYPPIPPSAITVASLPNSFSSLCAPGIYKSNLPELAGGGGRQ
jgi:hypothetical protein